MTDINDNICDEFGSVVSILVPFVYILRNAVTLPETPFEWLLGENIAGRGD